jgi:16S rRNA (guanine966-N2)-methyltransferase
VLRISGGSLRGRRLFGPEGLEFRPTTGRVKEFIFFLYQREIENSRFLDLFAGSGSLGLEALSRGAREGFFVEKSPQSIRLLKKNIVNCGFVEKAHLLAGDVFSILDRLGGRGEKFDVVFADPPFKESLHGRIVDAVIKSRVLKPDSILILEHEAHDPYSTQGALVLERQKKFGSCFVSVYSNESPV